MYTKDDKFFFVLEMILKLIKLYFPSMRYYVITIQYTRIN